MMNSGGLRLAHRITELREKCGLTQAQLADKVGTTQAGISTAGKPQLPKLLVNNARKGGGGARRAIESRVGRVVEGGVGRIPTARKGGQGLEKDQGKGIKDKRRDVIVAAPFARSEDRDVQRLRSPKPKAPQNIQWLRSVPRVAVVQAFKVQGQTRVGGPSTFREFSKRRNVN